MPCQMKTSFNFCQFFLVIDNIASHNYLRFLVKWNRIATCKTTQRNDCWITRSAREGDPEDKVNNSPNFLGVNKSLIESRIETRNRLSKVKFKFIYSHLFNDNTTTIRKKRSKNRANYTLN